MPLCDLFFQKLSDKNEEECSLPIDLSDIMSICKEYADLGWQIQRQIEAMLDDGVDESIKNGVVKQIALPHIKNFLRQVIRNPYFGDACSQANDCIYLIEQYEENNTKKPSVLN